MNEGVAKVKRLLWIGRAIIYKLRFKKIGNFSYIGKPIFIKGSSKICVGNKVKVFPGARIEVHGKGEIVIEDNCSIGQGLHLIASDHLTIGKNTTISSNVFITDTDHDYQELGVHILNQKHLIKKTYIGDNCFIGTGAKIHPGTILGKQCIIGSNAVVKGTYPDYCVIAGVPARIVKKYNLETKEWEKVN